jgi:hypothetical protein
MAVEVNVSRKAVEITWDTELVKGDTVDIRTENEGDVSGRVDLKNDGHATLTYPAEFAGQTTVTVTGSDGGEDNGVITV